MLYLKADEMISQYFTERELEQFQYEKNGKGFKMSYYMAPEDNFDDPEEAKIGAARSYEAAVGSKKPVKKAKKISEESTICNDVHLLDFFAEPALSAVEGAQNDTVVWF